MKYSLELVVKLLDVIIEHPHGFAPRNIEIEGFSPEEIGFHSYLMEEAGLVEATEFTHLTSPGPFSSIRNILMDGYTFHAAMQDTSLFEMAKEYFDKKGALGFIAEVIKSGFRKALGL